MEWAGSTLVQPVEYHRDFPMKYTFKQFQTVCLVDFIQLDDLGLTLEIHTDKGRHIRVGLSGMLALRLLSELEQGRDALNLTALGPSRP